MTEPDLLAGFGPFFATHTHTATPAPPWRRMSELVTGGAALTARMSQVRAALGASGPAREIEARVVASVTQLGLTSRLVAPVLGLAVLGVPEPVRELGDVYWQSEIGGPFPLSLPRPAPPQDPPAAVDVQALTAFVEGPVRALVEVTTVTVPVTPHVLWGNVASTVAAAGQMIHTARPDLAARAGAVVDAVLDHPLLRREFGYPHDRFRRRTCCLIYRVAAPTRPRSVCVDCVLDP